MEKYKVKEDLLTVNLYSRPNKKINQVKGIVIHWVANRNSTAQSNRNFFESRKNGTKGYGSAHEIIDLDGNILVCIPVDEMAYHVGSPNPYTKEALKYLSNYPNNCTYGIECTHIGYDGEMTEETYNTLVQRCADLIVNFNLEETEKALWLHKEVVGWKDCHRWFVYNPKEWELFKDKVKRKVEEMKLKLDETWQWNMLYESVKKLEDKKVLTSSKWKGKIEKKNISVHELVWLNTILMERLYGRDKDE
jgi:N-acetylmuramoyl-L-alanine amidase